MQGLSAGRPTPDKCDRVTVRSHNLQLGCDKYVLCSGRSQPRCLQSVSTTIISNTTIIPAPARKLHVQQHVLGQNSAAALATPGDPLIATYQDKISTHLTKPGCTTSARLEHT